MALNRVRGTPEFELTDHVAMVIDKVIRQLDEEHRLIVLDYLKQFPPAEQLAALDQLVQLTWRQNPVSPREFILSEDYLGLVDKRSKKPQIYDRVIDDLEEMFSGQYTEAVLTGGIGWGKSTFAKLAHAYMLYQLGCLVNPARAFGLADGSSIVLINVAINKTNASEIVFKGVANWIDTSPWFDKFMPRSRDKMDHIEFENGVWLSPFAALEKAVVGFDAFGGVMDEVNEMAVMLESTRKHRGEVVYDQAQTIRDAMIRRMESRFTEVGSKLPGILVQISSSKYPGEYTERRIQEAKDDPTIFTRVYTSWDTNRAKYSPTTFRLALATPSSSARILKTEVDEQYALSHNAEVIEVPDNLETHFTRDIHSAIRDFAGRTTAALTPFISRMDKVFDAVQRGKLVGLEHPFKMPPSSGRMDADEETRMATTLLDHKFSWEMFAKRFDPNTVYFAHTDLSKNNQGTGDRAGLAIGHIAGQKMVVGYNDEGKEIRTYKPYIVIDMAFNIIAPPDDEIRISSVKSFFLTLHSYGMRFYSITFDQWQSLSIIQDLRDAMIAVVVEELSIDRTPEPYQELKDTYYDDRIEMYEHPVILRELAGLEQNAKTGKIDHPPLGSKDMTDGLAGVVWGALHYAPAGEPIVMTSHGSHVPGISPEIEAALRRREEEARLKGVSPQSIQITEDDLLFGPAFDND